MSSSVDLDCTSCEELEHQHQFPDMPSATADDMSDNESTATCYDDQVQSLLHSLDARCYSPLPAHSRSDISCYAAKEQVSSHTSSDATVTLFDNAGVPDCFAQDVSTEAAIAAEAACSLLNLGHRASRAVDARQK